MWKWFLFNAALFWTVSFVGKKYSVPCWALALGFALAHHLLSGYVRNLEFFSLPDTRPIPECPGSGERGRNGMDCKSKGDRYGL